MVNKRSFNKPFRILSGQMVLNGAELLEIPMKSTRLFGLARFVRSAMVAIGCAAAAAPAFAVVKVIGDFEGNMDSPYTNPDPVSWGTADGITAPIEFISINDPDYVGGVTHGEQALLLTSPNLWTSNNFLELFGGLQMLEDMAEFPYMMVDVTTFGGPDTPDEGPVWRQMFSIYNGTGIGWYDSNPDNDNQHDFPVPGFADPSGTQTILIDMTGPDPPVHGDDKNFINLKAQELVADNNDGTPIEGLYWQLRFLFQGGDSPDSPTIQMAIDNVRFCDTLDCTPSIAPTGDYNNDGVVDAADYVVWRKNDTGGQSGYDDWRTNFGSSAAGLGSSATAVPEPAAIVLALVSCLISGVLLRRR